MEINVFSYLIECTESFFDQLFLGQFEVSIAI